MNALAELMGWPTIEVKYHARKSTTLLEFIDEIKSTLPLDELEKIYEEKMINDEAFKVS